MKVKWLCASAVIVATVFVRLLRWWTDFFVLHLQQCEYCTVYIVLCLTYCQYGTAFIVLRLLYCLLRYRLYWTNIFLVPFFYCFFFVLRLLYCLFCTFIMYSTLILLYIHCIVHSLYSTHLLIIAVTTTVITTISITLTTTVSITVLCF